MLYIMRHGKTDWNVLYKIQGRTDIPLNDTGRQMARDAHDKYMNVHFDVCFCSPLVRAKETAELLLEGRNVPVIFDDRLMEMSFGIYEGTERVYEKPDCPLRPLFLDPVHYEAVEGGESFEDLFNRTGEFLREVVDPLLKEGKDVLIVGHGAMNSSIVAQVKNIPLEKFWEQGIPNCVLFNLSESEDKA